MTTTTFSGSGSGSKHGDDGLASSGCWRFECVDSDLAWRTPEGSRWISRYDMDEKSYSFYNDLTNEVATEAPLGDCNGKLFVFDLSIFIIRSRYSPSEPRSRTVRQKDDGRSARIFFDNLRSKGHQLALWTCTERSNVTEELEQLHISENDFAFVFAHSDTEIDSEQIVKDELGEPFFQKRISTKKKIHKLD